METLKCKHCDVDMIEGYVPDQAYGSLAEPFWVEGMPERSWFTGLKTRNRKRFGIITYRCPQCGFLESYATKQFPSR
jgi:hypothetical protein